MNRGYYDRGKLPHRDVEGSNQAITFRLADALPTRLLQRWKRELAERLDSADPRQRDEALEELRQRIAHHEDQGHGSCVLRNPIAAGIVQRRLIASHPGQCELHAWVVMPNHVHVLCRLREGVALGRLLNGWKGGASREINRRMGRAGHLWQREYFDRAIRDPSHFHRARRYIHRNPVKAGLCAEPEDWPYSSAGIGWRR